MAVAPLGALPSTSPRECVYFSTVESFKYQTVAITPIAVASSTQSGQCSKRPSCIPLSRSRFKWTRAPSEADPAASPTQSACSET